MKLQIAVLFAAVALACALPIEDEKVAAEVVAIAEPAPAQIAADVVVGTDAEFEAAAPADETEEDKIRRWGLFKRTTRAPATAAPPPPPPPPAMMPPAMMPPAMMPPAMMPPAMMPPAMMPPAMMPPMMMMPMMMGK